MDETLPHETSSIAERRRFELLKPVKTCYLSKVVH